MRIPKSIRVSVKYLTLIGKNKLDLEAFCGEELFLNKHKIEDLYKLYQNEHDFIHFDI
jgi:hypothetical protein